MPPRPSSTAALADAKAARDEARDHGEGYGVTITLDQLVGSNLSAGEIMDTAVRTLKAAGATRQNIDRFRTEAYSGSYDHLCATVRTWLTGGGGWTT